MTLELDTIQHLNFVVEDYAGAQQHFTENIGAVLNWELLPPNRPDDVSASLITLGPTLFEIFGPEPDSTNGVAQILRDKGPGFIGIEWGVTDLQAAKDALKEHGVGIRYEPKKKYYPGMWFVSEPDDLFGLALECYIGTWYTSELPPGMKGVTPQPYWRDEHPLGIHGVRNFTVAVDDTDLAAKRWQGLTGATEVTCGPSADNGVRYFTAANTIMGLVSGATDSAAGEYVDRRGESIYSVTFAVEDPARVVKHLTANSVIAEQVSDAVVVVPAATNYGVRLEFVTAGA
ncbi:VOC family protein [Mycobacterium sp. E1747]|uniref:VOC family protein n=1 Tax=Mycobacterium sp. E1747 TaxID=1834128 RepID=UPI0007FE1B96|nr:VOC family protein [Mycobacterium sp. E1747]OBH05909.1 hypothetical protein A5695_06650 [Mycobacterium sp. E1747]